MYNGVCAENTGIYAEISVSVAKIMVCIMVSGDHHYKAGIQIDPNSKVRSLLK